MISAPRRPRTAGVLAAALMIAGAPGAACGSWLLATALAAAAPSIGFAAAAPRVEARNAELLAVGVVNGAAMSIHVSRLADNAPVRDATVSVTLRGGTHPAKAEADGGYVFESPDLTLPGDAAVEIRVSRGGVVSLLSGVLSIEGRQGDTQSNSRQLWWWALNFGVCFAFLYLWSRRKGAKDED